MDDGAAVTVEIRVGDVGLRRCAGPDAAGACPEARAGEPVPCAGYEVHVRPNSDDLWVFTAPPQSRRCPLGWVVTGDQNAPELPADLHAAPLVWTW